jgi:hypothetical protein
MKTFNAEFSCFIELSTDQQCDAEIMCERVFREIREVFASHGCISDCTITLSSISQKE